MLQIFAYKDISMRYIFVIFLDHKVADYLLFCGCTKLSESKQLFPVGCGSHASAPGAAVSSEGGARLASVL